MRAHVDVNGGDLSHQQFVMRLHERAHRLLADGDFEQAWVIEAAATKAYSEGEPNCRTCQQAAALEDETSKPEGLK